MNVSLADILIVHIVVFGQRSAPTETFKATADKIVAARPKSWQRLMRLSEQERQYDSERTYEAIAAAIKAKLDAATKAASAT